MTRKFTPETQALRNRKVRKLTTQLFALVDKAGPYPDLKKLMGEQTEKSWLAFPKSLQGEAFVFAEKRARSICLASLSGRLRKSLKRLAEPDQEGILLILLPGLERLGAIIESGNVQRMFLVARGLVQICSMKPDELTALAKRKK